MSYQKELGAELKLLQDRFKDWENKKIDGFELNEYIHKFHNGAAQEIWKKYNYTDADMIVASAAAFGILKRDEIPDEIFDIIEQRIKFIQKNRDA